MTQPQRRPPATATSPHFSAGDHNLSDVLISLGASQRHIELLERKAWLDGEKVKDRMMAWLEKHPEVHKAELQDTYPSYLAIQAALNRSFFERHALETAREAVVFRAEWIRAELARTEPQRIDQGRKTG